MRRNYLPQPKLQFLFTASFTAGVIIIMALLGGAYYLTLYLLGHSNLIALEQRAILLNHLKLFLPTLLWVSGLLIVVFSLMGIYLSYKLVGPLFRLETWLEMQLLGGDPPPIKLRKGDELEHIADVLIRLVSKHETDLKRNAT